MSPERGRVSWVAVVLVLAAVGGAVAVWSGGARSRAPDAAAEPVETGGPSLVERLSADVTYLAEVVGERHAERPQALAEAADWIVERLAAAGLSTSRESFDARGRPVEILVAERPGVGRADEIVVLGAHYDTARGTPGANDNGSGVAALLELARVGAGRSSSRTLRYVFFPNKERPWFQSLDMGSRVYASRCEERGERIVAMLSLDSLGYYTDVEDSQRFPDSVPGFVRWMLPDAGDFVVVLGDSASAGLAREVLSALDDAGVPCEGGGFPSDLEDIDASDHWSFWQIGVPAVIVSDSQQYRDPTWHGPDDLPGHLAWEEFARVVVALDGVAEALADPAGD